MSAWKRILDEDGISVASLNELYNGDWSITQLKSFDWITDTRFSTPSKAANWLWKNRHNLGEPFNLYEEKEKPTKKSKTPEPVIIEEPSEDLFWNYKK